MMRGSATFRCRLGDLSSSIARRSLFFCGDQTADMMWGGGVARCRCFCLYTWNMGYKIMQLSTVRITAEGSGSLNLAWSNWVKLSLTNILPYTVIIHTTQLKFEIKLAVQQASKQACRVGTTYRGLLSDLMWQPCNCQASSLQVEQCHDHRKTSCEN